MVGSAPCVKCGKPVRATTAPRTNGLCTRCFMRRVMECAERKDYAFALYSDLIERVHDSAAGFDGLSEPEKIYYAVALLRNEINNGGFHQYFSNSSGKYYRFAEGGLVSLGAQKTLELLHQAKKLIFAEKSVPTDNEQRRQFLYRFPEGELETALNVFDQRFYNSPDEVSPLLEAFAREQGLIE